MSARIFRNKRGKDNLICPQNYIYYKMNVQKGNQYWKCYEYKRRSFSAVAKTKVGEDILQDNMFQRTTAQEKSTPGIKMKCCAIWFPNTEAWMYTIIL